MKAVLTIAGQQTVTQLLLFLMLVPSAFSQENTNRAVNAQVSNDQPHESAAQRAPGDDASSKPDTTSTDIPAPLLGLFKKLDQHGRSEVKDAKFVELEISNEQPDKSVTEKAWLVSQDDKSIAVLRDDLITWIYPKDAVTTMPSSWQPTGVIITSITDANFEDVCRALSKPKDESAVAAQWRSALRMRAVSSATEPTSRA